MRQFNHDPAAVTRHREDAGLTKTALAKRLKCSLSLVSEIESGTRNARPALLDQMAEIFGCAVAELERPPEAPADVAVPAVRGVERPAGTLNVQELRGQRDG